MYDFKYRIWSVTAYFDSNILDASNYIALKSIRTAINYNMWLYQ